MLRRPSLSVLRRPLHLRKTYNSPRLASPTFTEMSSNNHSEDQPLSELSFSFKIAEIGQLDGLARIDLDLDADEGGILRTAGHRHNGVLITIPFHQLIKW